jgi:hypothetical protein
MTDAGGRPTPADFPAVRRWPRLLTNRWVTNLALLYGIIFGVGLLMGVLGAVGEDRVNQGVYATINYSDNQGHITKVEEQGTDPSPVFLVVYPAAALLIGTIFVLPVVLVALLIAEGACRVGIPPGWVRGIGVTLMILILLDVVWGDRRAGVVLFPTLGLLIYAIFVRLPAKRRGQ